MFWALAQRQKDIIKARREEREKAVEDIIQKLLERGLEIPPDVLKDIRDRDRL